jgi:heme-degrading monooxygenase HmoA
MLVRAGDAALLRTEIPPAEVTNGCIRCTLRDDCRVGSWPFPGAGGELRHQWPRAGSLVFPVQERRWIVGRIPPYGGAMSDHSEAPVAPVEAYEPPYYVAVFTTVRTQDQSGYSETNARMEDLVKDVPGFLGMDHAQTPGGLGITVGYFRDADALTQWRCNAEHRAAQKRGQAEWYESYTLHVAKVERSHGFIRAQVPQSPTAG